MSDTAFQAEEEQTGSGSFIPSAPKEEAMGPPTGLNDEQATAEKKKFNRSKMGGFLMELGLNILSSNRDNAGAAVGDAFGKTVADRDTRKRTAAADSLAQSEREREERRQDEADEHRRDKEARDVRKAEIDDAKESRAAEKAKADKLAGKDEDKLGASGEATNVRQAKERFDEIVETAWLGLEDIGSKLNKRLVGILGEDPSSADMYAYARKELDKKDRALLDKSPPENYKTRDWD